MMTATEPRCCDLVMKGGVTSGVLYPPAIARIAEAFHLAGIGGTSAGAIAACAAAAAEYRRRHTGRMDGFERLEEIPRELVGEGRLLSLFRPDAATAGLFKLVVDGSKKKQRSWFYRVRWWSRVGWTLLWRNRRLQPMIDNGYGLCSGMANGILETEDGVPPITPWLTDAIDEIAGLDGDLPLTFGDLRKAPIPGHLTDVMCGREHRSIDLRAVTTCVSFGRPMELPLDGIHIFGFDPDDFAGLFPERVVRYLVDQAEAAGPSDVFDGSGLLPFPTGDRMPVVVAARMSLSFPGLFTMIPLYAVDYEDPGHPYRKVWFSDGGITSNFPIHRFDALFPRWPTLAINLQYTGPDGVPARKNVDPVNLTYMIGRPEDGTRDLWHPFDRPAKAVQALTGFGGAIFRSAQVWHDNAFLALPGYRDRVMEMWLREHEGGLNLDMPPEVIEELIRRGNAAGIELRDRLFVNPPSPRLSWDAHRWTRLRSALSGLAEFLRGFSRSAEHPLPGDATLEELLADRERPPLHELSTTQYPAAKKAIEDLLAYVESLATGDACSQPDEAPHRPFCRGPRPPVEIGSRARF